MFRTLLVTSAVVPSLLGQDPDAGHGPSFLPDAVFSGASLEGWSTLGEADWRTEDGEVVGVSAGPGGGWLLMDRSYQDVGLFTSFRSTGGCTTGVLLRGEETGDGVKGVYVSLDPDDVAAYAVELDAQGHVTRRERLPSAGGQMRIAPAPEPSAARGGGGRGARQAGARRGRGRRGGGATVRPPLSRPDTSLRPGSWNEVEILLDANIVRGFLNDGGQAVGGVAEDDVGKYGRLALHIGGEGEVRFKDIAYKDLSLRTRAVEEVSSRFRMQQLSDFYYAWGAAAADFDRDGITDVVAGPHVYFGPDYLTRREIYLALTSNPSDTYTKDCWMQFAGDFTGDGWPDVIDPSFDGEPGVWMYVNPAGESRRWDKHLVVEEFSTEIAVLTDVDGDGEDELVYGGGGRVRYAEPDPGSPTGPWIVHDVSESGFATAHGIGAGDIDGDGLVDIVNPYGWWEQPAEGDAWAYHPEVFARYRRGIAGGSVMAVYDVNGDGLNDVVTVLNPHGWGLAWFEQRRDQDGISFQRHMVMDDHGTENAGGVAFSQPHGTAFGDVDGDGITDFIVGKRFWAHQDDFMDPDPYGPAVLYWYRTVRNPQAPGGAELVPELIHNRSGAGSHVLATDLDGDGRLDIVTATRYGTFIFHGQR